MPNPLWNNQHGANRSYGDGPGKPGGSAKPSSGTPEKTANWPGVPGKTQSADRSAGVKKTGKRGPFDVKKVGL